jgi:hypothetical protein
MITKVALYQYALCFEERSCAVEERTVPQISTTFPDEDNKDGGME